MIYNQDTIDSGTVINVGQTFFLPKDELMCWSYGKYETYDILFKWMVDIVYTFLHSFRIWLWY